MTKEDFILKDLTEFKTVGSWDWEADMRFAKQFYDSDTAELCRYLLKSRSPFAIQIAFHEKYIGKVKKDRLRVLRKLEKDGKIESFWAGTGAGGKNEFGVNRVKAYALKQPLTQNTHDK